MLPGGVANPDALRLDADAVAFVKTFVESGKPVAAICHAPWTLIEADVVRGKRITSWPSLQTDLRNAGAEWVDEQVVTDGNLITSRNPDDLPAFIGALLEAVNHGASSASSSGAWAHSTERRCHPPPWSRWPSSRGVALPCAVWTAAATEPSPEAWAGALGTIRARAATRASATPRPTASRRSYAEWWD